MTTEHDAGKKVSKPGVADHKGVITVVDSARTDPTLAEIGMPIEEAQTKQ